MAEIPADVLEHFEALVVSKLAPGKELKRSLRPLMEKLRAREVPSADPDRLLLIGESVEALLGAVSRNTTPFYERQTFALVTLFLGVDGGYAAGLDPAVLEALTNRAATTVHKQWLSVGSPGVKPKR